MQAQCSLYLVLRLIDEGIEKTTESDTVAPMQDDSICPEDGSPVFDVAIQSPEGDAGKQAEQPSGPLALGSIPPPSPPLPGSAIPRLSMTRGSSTSSTASSSGVSSEVQQPSTSRGSDVQAQMKQLWNPVGRPSVPSGPLVSREQVFAALDAAESKS